MRGPDDTTTALYDIYKRLLAETPYLDWQVTAQGMEPYVQATMAAISVSTDPRLDGK